MSLPTNLSYGTVVGRFLLAYADGSDVDPQPDGVAARGSIFFTPSPTNIKDITASPAPVTVLPATIECVLDSEGYLLGSDGTRGVRLLATDDPDGNPVNWTWGVEYRLSDQEDNPVTGIPSHSISLPGETTVDLTLAAPVPSANGTYYIVGPAGPSNVLTIGTVTTVPAGGEATATITGTSPAQILDLGIPEGTAATISVGTVTTGLPGSSATVVNSGTTSAAVFDFSIPQGEQGIQGIQGIQGETGATGAAGDAATIAVGTVTTGAAGSSATVTNSGTSSAAIFDFSIPQGIQGIQGIQGPQGEIGPIGPTGATGIEWQGTWSNTADYVNNDAVFYDGASWFAAGDPPVGEVPSLSSTYWFPLALQGATGPQGPQGIQGETGATGAQGEIGFPGFKYDSRRTLTNQYVVGEIIEYLGDYFICLANNDAIPPTGGAIGVYWAPYSFVGPQGPQGDAATITVGTVTTGAPGTSVIVTNVGTSNDAVFDFTIPKGDTGDLGSLSGVSPITYASNTIGFDWAATVLDDLGNVSVATPDNGDMLKYNSATSTWEKSNIIDGGNA